MHYTITVADTGQTPYTGAVVTDDLTGVLGNAAYDGDAAATAGTHLLRQPRPDLDRRPGPGGTATITYSVTVSNPDTGGTTLANTVTSAAPGSTCPPSGPAAASAASPSASSPGR